MKINVAPTKNAKAVHSSNVAILAIKKSVSSKTATNTAKNALLLATHILMSNLNLLILILFLLIALL